MHPSFKCIAWILFRNEPEYYNVVDNPIDMMRIQNKLKNEEYDDIEQFTNDVHLLTQNALAYYQVCLQNV